MRVNIESKSVERLISKTKSCAEILENLLINYKEEH